jgi:hypothetical protein
MKTLRPSTEDEMVLTFVRAEVESTDIGDSCRKSMALLGIDRVRDIDHGIATDPNQNRLRGSLLQILRGYNDNALFLKYPAKVEWRLVEAEVGELRDFKYAAVPSLIIISGETRRVGDGAKTVVAGTAEGKFSSRVMGTVASIKNSEPLPDMIAVESDDKQIVLLDGHGRATAYVISEYAQPIKVLIGTSPLINQWYHFEPRS